MKNPLTKHTHNLKIPISASLPALLSVALFSIVIFHLVIPAVESHLVAAKKQMLQELVETGIDTLTYYYGLEQMGELTRTQAQALAWGDLSHRRFGHKKQDYYWISDLEGRIIKHPYLRDYESLSLKDVDETAPDATNPGPAFSRIAEEQGSGFHQYHWLRNDGSEQIEEKLAYIKYFPPWDWVLGAGVYIEDVQAEISGLIHKLIALGGTILIVVLLLSAYLIYQMLRIERKRHNTFMTLSDSEARHRAMLESAPNPIIVCDIEGITLFINPAFTRIFGWRPDELIGRHIDFVPPENIAETNSAIQKAYDMPEGDYSFETRRRTRAGDVIDVLFSASVFRDMEGNAIGIVENLQDITRSKATEQALRESELTARAIGDTARDVIIMINERGEVTFWSKAGYDILGYHSGEMVGHNLHQILAPDRYHKAYLTGLQRFRQNGAGNAVGKTIELTALHKNGNELPVELSLASVHLKNRWHAVGILRDISERKRMEERSQQVQRLESLGTLAGGIAHDFNNLLMGIQGRVSLLLADLKPSAPNVAQLKGIEEHVHSAVSLTRQLLGFARSGKYEVKTTDMNALVSKTAEMFGRTRKEVRIDIETEAELWACNVDRGQIEQVLINMYVNAWQAMPGGGRLLIKTQNIQLDERKATQHEVEAGRFITISIIDTGTGIMPEIIDRIFEPFYTTKEMGRGTGLGLASSYGIVKNHGGFITVQSKLDSGTRFDIRLPAVEAEPEVLTEENGTIQYGNETILLVDDEDMILEVGVAIFNRLGYKVLSARGGERALEIYRDQADDIDLVILDMIMPDMSGEKLHDALKTINPKVKILLSSGYSIDDAALNSMLKDCSGFIQKPFDIAMIAQKLREVLLMSEQRLPDTA